MISKTLFVFLTILYISMADIAQVTRNKMLLFQLIFYENLGKVSGWDHISTERPMSWKCQCREYQEISTVCWKWNSPCKSLTEQLKQLALELKDLLWLKPIISDPMCYWQTVDWWQVDSSSVYWSLQRHLLGRKCFQYSWLSF